ncbi:histidinol phosphatase-like enzyme (inositol monophosphatase family) [Litoreibacter meonggei]|uniref:Histidinol phosphatase-like enzyme (Inositol monophosphatase family) n=1 Tax=Litoreibacter meonggei TaxID=1049199 RepID=A0A497X3V2_9RHOB|nr:inositol monophosphatase family protein [Litoreibacter meonggei]RLJ58874.1 histidinol phosphatase-like enzyme (inositol monophosphatase family) [Litoreibacter meonggei]
MPDTLATRLETALKLTETASRIALDHFEGALHIDTKDDASPVTIADQETEQSIRAQLEEAFPLDGIYGEEFDNLRLDSNTIWVVDPIDGTRSFIAGVPLFGMLLAMVQDNHPVLGICRLPALGQVYSAAKGAGATRNGTPIKVSQQTKLSEAMLFINEGEGIYEDEPQVFERLTKAGKLRRLSYDCQPHALVASGQIDAVVDYNLKPYDYLAMVPIIEEAGGVITDWQGATLDFNSDGRVVTASTPKLHAELLALLNAD